MYGISRHNLSAVDKHKHLGIGIESSLRWDAHINYIVGKANRVLGLIRRTFGSKAVSYTHLTLPTKRIV